MAGSVLLAIAAMGFGWLHTEPPPVAKSEIVVAPTGPVVVRELRALSRLETASIRVEKVIDLKDRQQHLHGLVEANDALLFVAAGEVVLGVDLAKLGDADIGFDEATKKATIALPQPEVFSTRFDEEHSYVHSRKTDLLADRNEALEATARREATKAFTAAGREPRAVETAARVRSSSFAPWRRRGVHPSSK